MGTTAPETSYATCNDDASVHGLGVDRDDDRALGGPSLAAMREHIKESFKRFDDGDKGWLNRHDLKCAFASLTGAKPSSAELEMILSRCPARQVDLRLFAAYMEERLTGEGRGTSPYARMEHARRIFKAFDVRRAGYVSLDDAVKAFATVAPSVTPGVVADVFREADVDGDGRVSREEFIGVFFGRNRRTGVTGGAFQPAHASGFPSDCW